MTAIVADAKVNGAGQRYLIQHSAGSGKTRSIAWTAHRLATLHDADNNKVFDSVIVVTDRTVLDAQLQEAVKQIESKTGVVATISPTEAAKASFGSKSAYLAKTLESGQLIIVVTIQTFPFVLKALQENQSLKGRRFAVIADEAHSSQTGQTATKLKQVLTAQEAAALDDGERSTSKRSSPRKPKRRQTPATSHSWRSPRPRNRRHWRCSAPRTRTGSTPVPPVHDGSSH